jgi:hypothetical protein
MPDVPAGAVRVRGEILRCGPVFPGRAPSMLSGLLQRCGFALDRSLR